MQAIKYTLDVEAIPYAKVVDITPSPGGTSRVWYACPAELWSEHLEAWRKAMREGNRTAPEPMPAGHCVFEDPISYGCVAYGDESGESRRKAFEAHWRGNLVGGGWLRDVKPERVEQIVKAAVDAAMAGQDLGATPFLVCVNEWL